MSESRRHTEFFGPDLGRGPFTSHIPSVAAVQVATALAQTRVPLTRSDADLLAHAEFIRSLADVLFPDFAEQIRIDVGSESGDTIQCTISEDTRSYSLLHVWLADAKGAGETAVAPASVSFSGGVVLQTITASKRWLILTPTTGVVTATINYASDRTWYLAAARHGRVYYSNAIDFD